MGMVHVAVLGHSLVPSSFCCDVPGVQISVFRKPGATWQDQYCEEFSGFWQGQYDLVIILLGGNDLAYVDFYPVFCRLKEFVQAALGRATRVRLCSVEPRNYDEQSRFDITTSVFNIRRHRYNRVVSRWIRRIGQGFIDIGKPWIARQRTRDGVHFDTVASQGLIRRFNRTIRGCFHISG